MILLSCTHCKRELPIDSFTKTAKNTYRFKRHSWCNNCKIKAAKELRAKRSAERPKSPRASRGGMKLSEVDVSVIKYRLNTGESKRTIAIDFDVNVSTIYSIANGRLWRHIEACD